MPAEGGKSLESDVVILQEEEKERCQFGLKSIFAAAASGV
jgi:hypothetical protein